MKKRVIASIIAVVVVGGIIGGAVLRKNRKNYVYVKAEQVSQGELKSYLSTTGIVKSQNMNQYFGPQGKVKKVNVKIGDKVKKGDLLITYEVEDLSTVVKQSEIQHNNALLQKQELVNQNNEIIKKIEDINYEIADIDSEISGIDTEIQSFNKISVPAAVPGKIQTLSQMKSTLEQQRDILVQQKDAVKPISNERLKQADNAVTLAKLNLDSAKEKLAKMVNKITSKNNGVVTALNVVEGGIGSGAHPAVVVQNIEDLKIVVSVGKYDAEHVKIDQSAVIKNSSNQYNGRVSYIAPTAVKLNNPTSNDLTLAVDINILDKNPELKIDFDVDTEILLAEAAETIKVPVESLKTDKNGKTYVYVIEESKAVQKEVKTGIESDTEVQIIKGLELGEDVILNPTDAVKHGVLVSTSTEGKKKKSLFEMPRK